MIKSESLGVGIVVERRALDNPWIDHEWVAVAAVPGAPDIAPWTELDRGDGWVRYHAGNATLQLFRKETEAYLENLTGARPAVYVVVRDNDDPDDDAPLVVCNVTVSAYECQDYMDVSDVKVEAVPMANQVAAWMRNFLDKHHVEQPFVKRRRDKVRVQDHKFGQEPLVELRRRRDHSHEDTSDG